ncbi:DUF2017 family protein [Microbacterium pullorum]|uniref:DUF2017 family protein n=1 Tax=Microbacterium pullorum TaxID=2762236 RepID=UPI00296A90EC|nr:DUF2017 family protein [Microbacterium pullorum]
MSRDTPVVLQISVIEAAHLADLVGQFAELLADSPADGSARPDDPALARLVPDAYRDDASAAQEFRSLTAGDLLRRRRDEAEAVLRDLSPGGAPWDAGGLSDDRLTETVEIRLTRAGAQAWLRTLNALRLVLATRLGIDAEDDHRDGDPRFAIYDWLGYRLDAIVAALDA